MSEHQIEQTSIVLSFGIRDDWAFEEEFSKRKDVKIYSYDYSTKEFLSRKFYRHLAGAVYHLIHLMPLIAKLYFYRLNLSKRFYTFFDNKKGRYFIPKFIGQYDNEQYTCFETIFYVLHKKECTLHFIN